MAFTHRFGSKAAAQFALQRVQQLLPDAPSAYQPSGKMPVAALAGMLIGAGAGVPAGVAAGLIVAVAGILLTWLIYSIHIFIGENVHMIFWGIALIAFLVGLAACVATFAAVGIAATATVHAAGRLGKNRNPFAECRIALASGLAGAAAFWILMRRVSHLFPDGAASALRDVLGMGLMGALFDLLAAVTVVVAVGVVAERLTAMARFCEGCQLYMRSEYQRPISFVQADAVRRRLEADQVDMAAAALNGDSGDQATPLLFHCPRCRSGYIEITAWFRAEFGLGDKHNSTGTMKKDWCALSRRLSAEQYDVLSASVRAGQ